MAEFKKIVITTKGQALMAKMIAGRGAIDFTKVTASDTAYTDAQLEGLIALTGIKQTTLVSKVIRTNNVAIQIEAAMTNTTLTAGYYMKTIGLYAVDPDDGEILYGVSNATVPGWMPPYNGITVSGAFFKLITTVGNAENVSLNVDPGAVATIGDVKALEAEISDLQAYVGYTDNSIVGVEVDFKNKKFTRLAGAVNKTPGAAFDNIHAFGGRRKCILTDSGIVLAYHGDPGYSETGKLTQVLNVNGQDYPVGTNVQVMVEQPKFYYKVVPLELEKIEFKEIDIIAFNTGCTASGTLGIKLNGTLFNVAVTAADNTAALVAAKVRAATFGGWTVSGSGTSAVFTCNTIGEKLTAEVINGNTGITTTVTKSQPGYIGKGQHMRKARYYVSDVPKAGFKLHKAFCPNNAEKNFIYLSAFEGSLWDSSAAAYILDDAQIADFTTDMLCSIANVKPISGLTQALNRGNTRKLAQKRGSGWEQSYGATASVTQMLFMIEYNSFNMQEKLGIGVTNKPYIEANGNDSELTGATTNLGNGSGSVTNVNGFNVVTYRGEENFFGNIWKFVDGLNINAKGVHELYVADSGFADDKITDNYKNAGITLCKTNGYISAFGYNEEYDWLFFPSETVGNTSLPVGDYFYQNNTYNGIMIALLGGGWLNGANAGGFYWHVTDVSGSSSRDFGGRLVYVPA